MEQPGPSVHCIDGIQAMLNLHELNGENERILSPDTGECDGKLVDHSLVLQGYHRERWTQGVGVALPYR